MKLSLNILRRAILGTAISVVISLTALSAQEWGVDSTTNFGINQDSKFHLTAGESVSPWFKLPISDAGSKFEGSAHIGVDFALASDGITSTPVLNLLGDLDTLKLTLVAPNPTADLTGFTFGLGRYYLSDPTGNILNHRGDGVDLGFSAPGIDLSVNVAFTGLLLKNSTSIFMTNTDLANRSDTTTALGSPRLLYQVTLGLPQLGTQSLSVWALAQQDLTSADKVIPEWSLTAGGKKGGLLDSEYAGLQIGGPIVGTLFYNAWFTYEVGKTLSLVDNVATTTDTTDTVYQYKPITAFAFGGELNLYFPKILSSAFGFRFMGASGDADSTSPIEGNTVGDSTQFVPVTPANFGTVFSPSLSNMLFFELSGSLIPFESLPIQTGVKLMTFVRPTVGPISASGINPSSTGLYLGSELDIFAVYRILSDLGLSLSGGFFIPSYSSTDPNSVFLQASGGLQFALKVVLTLNM